jgi:hypothetical protein
MLSENLKNIETALKLLTNNHSPELSSEYMDISGQKLRNNDKNTADVTLITEDSSAKIYAYMRKVLGENPFSVE